eukprot:Tbor_TRINITY_DN5040_c0_g1::TRINITY_DN5040_c0_g1_i1::g.14408::m.14408
MYHNTGRELGLHRPSISSFEVNVAPRKVKSSLVSRRPRTSNTHPVRRNSCIPREIMIEKPPAKRPTLTATRTRTSPNNSNTLTHNNNNNNSISAGRCGYIRMSTDVNRNLPIIQLATTWLELPLYIDSARCHPDKSRTGTQTEHYNYINNNNSNSNNTSNNYITSTGNLSSIIDSDMSFPHGRLTPISPLTSYSRLRNTPTTPMSLRDSSRRCTSSSNSINSYNQQQYDNSTDTELYESESPEGADDRDPSHTLTGKMLPLPYSPSDTRFNANNSCNSVSVMYGGAAQLARPPLCLADYKIILEASQRSGNVRVERYACYKIGEILSRNKRDSLHQSVPYFVKFLNICRNIGDTQGEAKAFNCLGIVFYNMCNATDNNPITIGMSREDIIMTAAQYHYKHATMAATCGQFIAYTNLGICFHALAIPFNSQGQPDTVEGHIYQGDEDILRKEAAQKAKESFTLAIHYAVAAGDKVGEALGLSNLSEALGCDSSTSEGYIHRTITLSEIINDPKVSTEANTRLGEIAAARGDYAASLASYGNALQTVIKDSEMERLVRCRIGIVQGQMQLGEYIKDVGRKMSVRT